MHSKKCNIYCGLDIIWKLMFYSILHFRRFKKKKYRPAFVYGVTNDVPGALIKKKKKKKNLVASKLSKGCGAL